ncbi:hypothetical protein K438DRAFT_1988961 [Mycena galopus ATCC 62051]|nr:hypothetical protein K438DRAFT_1988961 [Mycena galopus ATCC 62051]
MPSTAHACICASEESWHEIPAKEWRAHQAELEDTTIALETARSVPRDNPESASEDPAFIHPESLLVDLVGLPKEQIRTNHVAPALRTLALDVDQGSRGPEGTQDQARAVTPIVAEDHEHFVEYGVRWSELASGLPATLRRAYFQVTLASFST